MYPPISRFKIKEIYIIVSSEVMRTNQYKWSVPEGRGRLAAGHIQITLDTWTKEIVGEDGIDR